MNITISKNKWLTIINNHIGLSGDKKRINNGFINQFMNENLLKFNLKCVVQCRYNWFKIEESRKIKCPYWRGVFVCKNCSCSLTALIDDEPIMNDDCFMKIEMNEQETCKENMTSKVNPIVNSIFKVK
jgi:formylmethanofuran dehydrogenase subunit E-like metal-binding protein